MGEAALRRTQEATLGRACFDSAQSDQRWTRVEKGKSVLDDEADCFVAPPSAEHPRNDQTSLDWYALRIHKWTSAEKCESRSCSDETDCHASRNARLAMTKSGNPS